MRTEYRIRLDDIQAGPWRRQSLPAREKVTHLSPEEASRYFRSHYESDIKDRDEIAFRESFDEALEELQLLELAVGCGYLPLDEVRPVVKAEFQALFPFDSARKYLKIYDFVPVRFLAARMGIDLGLGPVTPPPINSRAALRYATFLALHSDFAASDPIEKFTMLLDDYRFGGIDARSIKEWLAGDGPAPSDSEQAIVGNLCLGMVQFIQTLGDLFLQLEHDEKPLFGSVYAYWLSHFLGVRRTEQGYRSMGVSFEDLNPNPLLFPPGLEQDALASEQQRLRHRIGILRGVWDQTRSFIESFDTG